MQLHRVTHPNFPSIPLHSHRVFRERFVVDPVHLSSRCFNVRSHARRNAAVQRFKVSQFQKHDRGPRTQSPSVSPAKFPRFQPLSFVRGLSRPGEYKTSHGKLFNSPLLPYSSLRSFLARCSPKRTRLSLAFVLFTILLRSRFTGRRLRENKTKWIRFLEKERIGFKDRSSSTLV